MSTRNELLGDILTAIQGGGGVLPADNCRIGFLDYNDAATATTPISVTGGGGFVDLTNDGAGPFTNKIYAPVGVSDVWDGVAGQFDWTDLKLGDMVDIRLDIEVTTASPNTNVIVNLDMAIGGSGYSIPFSDSTQKNAGAHTINVYNGIYMGDANTLNNGAKFSISSDGNATVIVRGWYCKVLVRGA